MVFEGVGSLGAVGEVTERRHAGVRLEAVGEAQWNPHLGADLRAGQQ